MKHLLVILTLIIAGCTSEKSPNTVNVVGLKSELADTREQLSTCRSQLEFYRSGSSSNNGLHHDDRTAEEIENTESSEPQYETVARYDIETKYGKTSCYTRNDGDDEKDIGCGMTFSDCKDGYVYRCMTDVKYKIVEEQKLVE